MVSQKHADKHGHPKTQNTRYDTDTRKRAHNYIIFQDPGSVSLASSSVRTTIGRYDEPKEADF